MIVYRDCSYHVLIFQVTDGLENVTITQREYCSSLNKPDQLLNTTTQTPMTRCEANVKFYSMQYSLLINVFVVGIGALFFFLTAIWIVKDKLRAENPELDDDAKRANPGETKEMLCIMESGELEDSIDSDDIPPTMIISKSGNSNSITNCKYDTAHNIPLTKPVDECTMSVRSSVPDPKFEERNTGENTRFHSLNQSAISKFQRLLETPDTSNERLNTGQISNSSSTPPSPATPKSLRL